MIRPLVLIAVLARAAASSPVTTIDPPPGWADVSAQQKNPAVLLALKGPETSSFVLARIKPIDFDNRGAVRTYLLDVLSALNRRTGMNFVAVGNIAVVDYENGLDAQYIRADLDGKPRLIVAAARMQGLAMVATLSSAVADTMLPSILGAVKVSGAGPASSASGPRFETEDGQLSLALPKGASSRALTPQERKQGFVAAVDGWDSELMIMKVEGAVAPELQGASVESAVRKASGVLPNSVAAAALLSTSAGPALVYSYGRVAEGSQFSAGFLPWCYWGYSALANGPRAQELLAAVLSQTQDGSEAEPRLVAATPSLALAPSWELPAAAAGAVFLVLLLVLLARRRRDVVGYEHGQES